MLSVKYKDQNKNSYKSIINRIKKINQFFKSDSILSDDKITSLSVIALRNIE